MTDLSEMRRHAEKCQRNEADVVLSPPIVLALLDVVEAAKPFSDDEFAGTGGIFANIREALARLAALNEEGT